IDIVIYKFDNETGYIIDQTISAELSPIATIDEQVFKLFDIDGDGISEIIRVSSGQVDVIYLDQDSKWVNKADVIGNSGYAYYSFDLFYDEDISKSVMIIVQEEISTSEFYFAKYQFNSTYDLDQLASVECPEDLIPTSIKIIENLVSTGQKAILIGGRIVGS
ncbi:unnamed protein product, partial [marine sediment metagenome]